MADRNELLAGIADHIGVLERWKRGTPAWWTKLQGNPGGINGTRALEEKLDPPMSPVVEPILIFHGPVEDAPQITEQPSAPKGQRRPRNVSEAVAQLRVGAQPANSVEIRGEVPNW